MDEQTELLREIRDLLRILAGPGLAERDRKLRASLIDVVGRSKPRAEAVLLMDGSRSQAEVRKESGIDQGNLSRLVSTLRAKELIKDDEKHPKLVIEIPSNFFQSGEETQ